MNSALDELNDARLRPVFVRINDGDVRLDGCVRSYYAKQLALHAVMSVEGIKQVVDNLIVK